AAASAMSSADRATPTAPSTPATMPAPIQRARPGTPRVAANTTLTISAASSTSRKTSTAMPAMGRSLFRDQRAFGTVLVEVPKERISTRLQRTHENGDRPLRWDDLLAIEFVALELLSGRILIFDD